MQYLLEAGGLRGDGLWVLEVQGVPVGASQELVHALCLIYFFLLFIIGGGFGWWKFLGLKWRRSLFKGVNMLNIFI